MFVLSLFVLIVACSQKPLQFADLPKIDAHIHFRVSGPEVMEQVVATNFKVVNIVVDHSPVGPQKEFILKQKALYPNDMLYVTSFPIEGWDEPDEIAMIDEMLKDL